MDQQLYYLYYILKRVSKLKLLIIPTINLMIVSQVIKLNSVWYFQPLDLDFYSI